MLIRPKHRQLVKKCLLITNIVMGIIFMSLFVFGLIILRPNIIAQAINNGQYYNLNLNHLPQELDTIEPDYIGKKITSFRNEPDSDFSFKNKENILEASNDNKPKIAIIITNLGINKRINGHALKLPAQVSFGVLSNSNNMQTFINEAQASGHEIYFALPNTNMNNGENHTNISQDENGFSFNNLFNMAGKYNGFYSARENILNTLNNLKHFSAQLEDKNLIFITKEPDNSFVVSKNVEYKNILQASLIIDPDADEAEIKNNLDQLVKVAKTNKKALGYANGYLLTIEMINKWIHTLETQGIELVPVTIILDRQKM